MTVIQFENVYKQYQEGINVIDNLSLEIKKGEFVTLVGPSGCGKTTLLRMINKLTLPTKGYVRVYGKLLSDWDKIKLRRSIGYVIQEVGLFPHMTIEKNITYVPNLLKEDDKKKPQLAKELINLVGMDEEFLKRYPRQLSGGQNQRIGVARALAADPEIILMDEPFGAVDEIARRALQDEIKKIHKKLKKTIIFVTHDMQEALKLGTKIILINEGKISQQGTSEDIVFGPKNDFVKEFFGTKGFKATLNEEVLENLYNDILSGKIDKENVIKSIFKN